MKFFCGNQLTKLSLELIEHLIHYKEGKMTKETFIIFALIILLTSSGCVVNNTEGQLTEIMQEYRIKNQQILSTMGEREYDTDKFKLIKATIDMFSNKNTAVITIDKELGYLLAEGSGFMSPEKFKEIGMQNIEELNRRIRGSHFVFSPGNDNLRFSINFFGQGINKTRIKVGISSTVKAYQQGIIIHELPPSMTLATYNEFWSELEKEIFIAEERKILPESATN